MPNKPADGSCAVHIDGEMTIYTAAEQKAVLFDEIENCDTLALELSGVDEIDSAGIQILMALKRQADQTECKLQLVNPSPSVCEVLDLFKLDIYFSDDSLESADEDAA